MQVTLTGGNVVWVVRPVEGGWLAQCEPLKLCIDGSDPEDVNAAIVESIDLLMRSLVADGHFDQFLRDRGWELVSPIPPGVPVDQLMFRAPMRVERDPYVRASA